MKDPAAPPAPGTPRRAGRSFLDGLGDDPYAYSMKGEAAEIPSSHGSKPQAATSSPTDQSKPKKQAPPPETVPTRRPSTASADEPSEAGPEPRSTPSAMAKFSCQLPRNLEDRMYGAIDALAGPPLYMGVTEFIEEAVRSHVEQLEKEHNRGMPFPPSSKQARNRRGRR